ncbi:hypothetical protein K466DRAFT_249054 [Polyporus arcularius HHB13444]|uniref:Uncharacterized protein n=1 Tax=Polyporus arcularius HHB13444 TaxID=1314778 RepID=A0A5C3P4M0_9APHY|nr:hypothetical protein K466DRAFT_249054 [Polyporus arcularius HHB13444]
MKERGSNVVCTRKGTCEWYVRETQTERKARETEIQEAREGDQQRRSSVRRDDPGPSTEQAILLEHKRHRAQYAVRGTGRERHPRNEPGRRKGEMHSVGGRGAWTG